MYLLKPSRTRSILPSAVYASPCSIPLDPYCWVSSSYNIFSLYDIFLTSFGGRPPLLSLSFKILAMTRQEFFDLIDKWTKGEATEQELKALMNYYYSFRNTPEWDELEMGNRLQLEAEMEEQLLANIRQQPQEEIPVRPIWWRRIAVAAVLLIIAGAMWMYFVQPKRSSIPLKEGLLTALPGQHRFEKLPNGTQVWLSPASTLRYTERSDNGAMNLQLEGEAFFEVQKDAARSFTVVTGTLCTTVLGTAFGIPAYRGQRD